MRIAMLALVSALAALPAAAAAEYTRLDDLSLPGSNRYERCLSLTRISAQSAYEAAMQWGNSAPAAHCAAVALTGLKRYAEAATKLEQIARDKSSGDAAERATIYDQAGNAWLLAGSAGQADANFTAGLTLSPNNADLLLDRARAKAMDKNWAEAERDLSAALARSPSSPEIFVLRASARHALGRKEDARADLEAALQLKPDFSEALLERGSMKLEDGDTKGARADWQMVIDSAPRSHAAKDARQKIDDIDPAVAVPH